jgi:hypothetical protein
MESRIARCGSRIEAIVGNSIAVVKQGMNSPFLSVALDFSDESRGSGWKFFPIEAFGENRHWKLKPVS